MIRAGASILVLLALASMGHAEAPPLFSLTAGPDVLCAEAADILIAEAGEDGFGGQVLNVKLDHRLDAAVAELSQKHIGERLGLSICGALLMEPVLQVPLPEANFQIALKDAAEAKRLAALLRDGRCDAATE